MVLLPEAVVLRVAAQAWREVAWRAAEAVVKMVATKHECMCGKDFTLRQKKYKELS